MTEFKIPIRIEDLSPLATWLFGLVKENQADFKDYSPDFSIEYTKAFDEKIKAIDLLLSSKIFVGELSKATEKLNENMLLLRPHLLKLEGYAVRAKSTLNVPVDKFDFSGIRKSINGGDAEGFNKKLGILIQVVDKNQQALESKGMKADTITALTNILTNNKKLTQDQNVKMLAKEKAVVDNSGGFYDLWKDCQNIMDAGKRIYKYSKPEIVKNFTKTHIVKTMRNDAAHSTKTTTENA